MKQLAYVEGVEPRWKDGGYADRRSLQEMMEQSRTSRAWYLGLRLVSVQIKNGGIWKDKDRLRLHNPQEQIPAIQASGVEHPSSFADCYHQLADPVKRLPWTYNGMFRWWSGGPWSEARSTGEFSGLWKRYDLTSAYRWAATLGLPEPETYSVHTTMRDRPGLWIVEICDDIEGLPAVFRVPGPVVMSSEEIEGYHLRVKVIRGVTWTATKGTDYVEKTLTRLPCAKESGRAYWGRWIARDEVGCWTASGKSWRLPNRCLNLVWGWLIVGRVRLRVWQAAQYAAHVYVDEVLVPHDLPTGYAIGDWHLKQEYPDGIIVRRTGCYGSRAGNMTMHTGAAA